jgi:hypothetical protein
MGPKMKIASSPESSPKAGKTAESGGVVTPDAAKNASSPDSSPKAGKTAESGGVVAPGAAKRDLGSALGAAAVMEAFKKKTKAVPNQVRVLSSCRV